MSCSSGTAEKIDHEVMSIINRAHAKAIGILKENTGKLHEIARVLLEKETMSGEEFMRILAA